MITTIKVSARNLDLVYEAVESYKWSIQQLVRQMTSTPVTGDTITLARLKAKVSELRELEFMIADLQEGFDENWPGNAVLNSAATEIN
jgi:replication initiation and membrane attachment protein DnaB